MLKSRSELDAMLDELERDLQMLIMDDADQADLWEVFGRQADAIESSSGPADIDHVRARTHAILASKGIVAPDEASD